MRCEDEVSVNIELDSVLQYSLQIYLGVEELSRKLHTLTHTLTHTHTHSHAHTRTHTHTHQTLPPSSGKADGCSLHLHHKVH